MGASFDCRVYEHKTKKKVAELWGEEVEDSLYDYGHSYSGAIGMLGLDIQWRAEAFKKPSECKKFIEDRHEKWEPPMAVAFDGGWVVGGWCSS